MRWLDTRILFIVAAVLLLCGLMVCVPRTYGDTYAVAGAAAPLIRRSARKRAEAAPLLRPRRDGYVLTVARVGVQLAREDAAHRMHVYEVAGHAVALAKAGIAVRAALEHGESATKHYAAARAVAHLFCADIVEGALPGMVLGLEFSSGQYVSGERNIFFVA